MSPSRESDSLRALYQGWTDRMVADPAMDLPTMRDMFDQWHSTASEPEDVRYKTETVAGVPVIWALPDGADEAKLMIYTHGGGFAVGSADSHRKMAGHTAKACGANAIVVDYRRAPEDPFPAQLEDSLAVYKELLDRGYKAENMSTIGDSAGGNLAVASVLKFREEGLPLPGCVIAYSPWLDMEHKGKTLDTNADTDALVSRAILEGMAGMFLPEGASPSDPLANPLYADLTGFPRLYINVGGVETLRDNGERLHALATAAGVDSTLSIVDGMQHVFPSMSGTAPEVDEEIQRVATWYKK
ncbi:acetyl esterase/lipase [Antricoccus suffuscus]|uniref:Acetyl esterase/lipase n=1 Tax=Antricoccus suffuscus TaxID=1629062 RepID=A0A2T0ZZK3_9ACTN|nr:alpha/beta hydrolase [Antricoccus suffuscus]PRZ41714.1 acetyl esterase/lipase [Antricoccus suffuscus]